MKIRLAKFSTLALAVMLASSLYAQDGEALYKQKCAMCHGPAGEGKSGPALKGTKLSEDDVLLVVSKGEESKKAPHKKAMAGMTDEQLKQVAHYVKSLK